MSDESISDDDRKFMTPSDFPWLFLFFFLSLVPQAYHRHGAANRKPDGQHEKPRPADESCSVTFGQSK